MLNAIVVMSGVPSIADDLEEPPPLDRVAGPGQSDFHARHASDFPVRRCRENPEFLREIGATVVVRNSI